MPRLVPIVEGRGDTKAVQKIVAKLAGALNPRVVVTHSFESNRHRLGRPDNVANVCRVAMSKRDATLALIVFDADKDCAAELSTKLRSALASANLRNIGLAIAVQEYEAWLLPNLEALDGSRWIGDEPESIRDAKGTIRRMLGSYTPTEHQEKLTSRIDVARTRSICPSFDKLVREVERLCASVTTE